MLPLRNGARGKNPEERSDAIIAHLNRELSKLPEAVAFAFPPPAIQGIGMAGGATVVLEDRAGKSIGFLAQNLNKFVEAVRKRPEIERVTTTFVPGVPQIWVDVDRDKVLRQGVDVGQVYQTLQAFMGGYFINYFNRFGRQWQVYVQAEGKYRTKAEDIGRFYVTNDKGNPVPLSAVTSILSRPGPEFTMRYNLYRAAQINVAGKQGYSSGQVMNAVEEVFRQTMPPEMGIDYIGMSFQEKKAREGVPASAIFGLSLLCVFLILAAQYESWSLPFSVLLCTPVAVFGAFLAIYSRGLDNNIYAQIGLIVLIGLGAKNAILIVEFAKAAHERGNALEAAALEGARLRLRPILMTSFAFLLGVLPLAFSSGAGGMARRVMGTAVMGGTAAASVIAVFLIPVTFYVVGRITDRSKKAQAERGGEGGRPCVRPSPASCLIFAMALSACMVGPDYRRPAVDTPEDWRFADKEAQDVGRYAVVEAVRRPGARRPYRFGVEGEQGRQDSRREGRAVHRKGHGGPGSAVPAGDGGRRSDADQGLKTIQPALAGLPAKDPYSDYQAVFERKLADRPLGPVEARHGGGQGRPPGDTGGEAGGHPDGRSCGGLRLYGPPRPGQAARDRRADRRKPGGYPQAFPAALRPGPHLGA